MIRQSESIASLAKALVAAQAELEGVPKATKGQVGNAVRYYADLATVIEAVRDTLAKHKLAYLQFPSDGDTGRVVVTTRLIHESGEWMEDGVSMPAGNNGAQGVGSAITYARRYSLMAALGLAPEDDDGAAASQPAKQTRSKPKTPSEEPQSADALTEAQRRGLHAGFGDLGISDRDERLAFVVHAIGRDIDSSNDLTKTEAALVFDAIAERKRRNDAA